MNNPFRNRPQGASYEPGGETTFRIWAPRLERLDLVLDDKILPMRKEADGFFEARAAVSPGARYGYRIDGRDVPDPASRFQPDGLHGLSAVVDLSFEWTDSGWRGTARKDAVRRTEGESEAILAMNFSGEPQQIDPGPLEGSWTLVLDTADPAWLGPGAAAPAVIRASGPGAVSLAARSLAAWVREPADR